MRHESVRRLLTNNGRFTPGHTEYRRVVLLNVIILLFMKVAVIFLVLNLLGSGSPVMIAVNASAAFLCALLMVFFHRTDKVEASSYIIVGLIFCQLAVMLLFVGNQSATITWIGVFPAAAFFLLDRKKAILAVTVFLILLTVYLAVGFEAFAASPEVFTYRSVCNVLGASLSLSFLVSYFDLSRRDSMRDALLKNEELEAANRALTESKQQLRLILDSTAEAIFGLDGEGRCTFCNASCLELLGFAGEDELIGQDMHMLIHSRKRDGSPLERYECDIIRTCMDGTASHVDDGFFWRGDTGFDVAYHSYPQYKDGTLVGAVVTFTDNTLKKIHDAQVRYFSSHDALTALLNRSYFEATLRRMDVHHNLPLSVIMGDLNGLKLTNDVFGHAAGDELLIKAAEILKKVCRESDVIARFGGDEFVILLPRTTRDEAQAVIRRMQELLSKEKSNVIRCSMSLGCDTKEQPSESIDAVMKNAENRMYQDKSRTRNKVDADMINAIIMSLYSKFPPEEQHSLNVSEYCRAIGEAMGLSAAEIILLRRAGLLHDIGKVVVDSDITIESDLSGQDDYSGRQHPAVGFRILNLFDSTVSIAEAIYSHHEHWDGSGYPRGLKGPEIPLLARIIAVAGQYDHMRRAVGETAETTEAIITALQKEAGTRFDPNIVDIMIDVLQRQLI